MQVNQRGPYRPGGEPSQQQHQIRPGQLPDPQDGRGPRRPPDHQLPGPSGDGDGTDGPKTLSQRGHGFGEQLLSNDPFPPPLSLPSGGEAVCGGNQVRQRPGHQQPVPLPPERACPPAGQQGGHTAGLGPTTWTHTTFTYLGPMTTHTVGSQLNHCGHRLFSAVSHRVK